ncbi:hypothetical protein Tco_0360644 [Tanacetum coccineum]
MYELLQMMQSFCEKLLHQKQAASIDQSPLQEMSIQDIEDLKQHYLNEMLSLSNDLQIKDYRNEKIDIRFRRECESMIDELKGKFNGMSIEINKNVEDLVPIPSESKDASESDSDCDLASNVYEEKFVTFSNPVFDSNDDCTSSDDESLSDEVVPEDKVKIYSNPLFKFDDEYISSDVDPLFDEVLENIESGDVDEIEFLLCRDPSTPKMSIVSILEGFTDEPPLEENDDLFDLESKANDWKKILYDA